MRNPSSNQVIQEATSIKYRSSYKYNQIGFLIITVNLITNTKTGSEEGFHTGIKSRIIIIIIIIWSMQESFFQDQQNPFKIPHRRNPPPFCLLICLFHLHLHSPGISECPLCFMVVRHAFAVPSATSHCCRSAGVAALR